jgi:CRISPR-associated endoribonuclease Cas6
MRLKVELVSSETVILPTGYNAILQGVIYNFLDRLDATWLHDRGFTFEKRSFKLFTFSEILERAEFDPQNKSFTFPRQISFILASPVDWILEQLALNLVKAPEVRLGHQSLAISAITVIVSEKITENSIRVRAITPIENHSTFSKPDGKKVTHYYSPFETEFSNLTNQNLRKKWTALFQRECPYHMTIQPLFTGSRNERIVYFGTGEHRTITKGWKGNFMLQGDPEFLQFSLDAGLGSRNSQGFGLVGVERDREKPLDR